MIRYPCMLKAAAIESGMKVPSDADEYEPNEYPHWHVYVRLQVGKELPSRWAHWDNAKVIASLSVDELKELTLEKAVDKGFLIG